MDLEEYLAIPFVLDVRAVQGEGGDWLCELEYEELPGCIARARSPLVALDKLEEQRIQYMKSVYERGEEPQVSRLPLRYPPYGSEK
jgi:hypothetical protein